MVRKMAFATRSAVIWADANGIPRLAIIGVSTQPGRIVDAKTTVPLRLLDPVLPSAQPGRLVGNLYFTEDA